MKTYIIPESRKIELNLNENIANSGKTFWIKMGEVGEDEILLDEEGAVRYLVDLINKRFGN